MKTTAILLLAFAAGCTTVSLYYPPSDAIWPVVAQAEVITTGKLAVPAERIRSCLSSNHHDYVEIRVARGTAIKGNPPEDFVVRWYTEPRDYAPDPNDVIALNGKDVILFLVNATDEVEEDGMPVTILDFKAEEPYADAYFYFAGYTPQALIPSSAAELEDVQHEASTQQQLLANFSEAFPPSEEPLYTKVRKLIDATTRKDSQMAAFRELEKLGSKAVPAIIMLMDDRRDLAIPTISLRNHSDHWEARRLYGPKKVVDAMAAILNQITGQYFGNIHNGGSEMERQATVDGWRIYLYYWKKDVHKE